MLFGKINNRNVYVIVNHNIVSLKRTVIEQLWRSKGRKIVIYTYGNRSIANRIAVEFPDSDLFEFGGYSSTLADTRERARALGYQLAVEIFSEALQINNLNIIITGYENLHISSLEYEDKELTSVFLSELLESMDPEHNRNSLYFISSTGDEVVEVAIKSIFPQAVLINE
ncbi:TVG0251088 [Thermoplasma volcanium GSS1]|uniref:TVG0251088 protein n=1 Tax=Thermoplasma volcanium (strain ATCC 51530 / DSM 4299 / JCM 9571 / NBRC 15438 / GSS1) TaxID=273116 RepID=Q97C65_THEVO|nr:hypothetical protein [Thermoplasma volcanium]BAB59382.1 TVG0251088 [Thermoplasma volcanium GSS1]